MKILEGNLRYIESKVANEKSMHKALALLDASSEGKKLDKLYHLLRDAEEEGVSDAEIKLRDGFDIYLWYVGILEIASYVGFIGQLPRSTKQILLKRLSNPALKHYYERVYPILLPQLFRARLEGLSPAKKEDYIDVDTFSSQSYFLRFFEDTNRIYNDEDIIAFLWLLDNGSYGDYDISDMMKIIKSPKQLIKALSKPPKEMLWVEAAILGMLSFLQFSVDFNNDLIAMEDRPWLRGLCYENYSYWYRKFPMSLVALVEGSWKSFEGYYIEVGTQENGISERDFRRSLSQEKKELIESLSNLMSGKYSVEHWRAVKSMSNDTHKLPNYNLGSRKDFNSSAKILTQSGSPVTAGQIDVTHEIPESFLKIVNERQSRKNKKSLL